MKKIAFILALLIITGCATSSTTGSPANIDGIWGGVYNSGMIGQPPTHFTFVFQCDGESLTGNMNNAANGPDLWMPLEEGKIKGDKVSFKTKPAPTMTYNYKGKIDGDEIKITFKVKMSGRQNMGRSSRGGGSMGSNDGSLIRSGQIMSMGQMGGPGMSPGSPSSEEFTIRRVKQ